MGAIIETRCEKTISCIKIESRVVRQIAFNFVNPWVLKRQRLGPFIHFLARCLQLTMTAVRLHTKNTSNFYEMYAQGFFSWKGFIAFSILFISVFYERIPTLFSGE